MQQPNFQIKKISETKNSAQFSLEPLPQGYGHTLGNALRRVLLTSLPGAAITQVKINGVKHRFSTLPGLKEDIVELCLNLKEVRIKYEGEKPVKVYLEKTGPGEVKAGDIQAPPNIEIVNKDLILGNLANKKSRLKMTMVVESGVGYLPLDERKSEKLGVILLDAIFSPIKRVNYRVEATRVGRQTDLDKLFLEIFTDGTIKPQEALKEAAKILIEFFSQIVNPKRATSLVKKIEKNQGEILKLTLEELNLPTRIVNALRKAGYETARDLISSNVESLKKVKNLGEKSIKLIYSALSKKGIKLNKDET